MDIYHVLNRGVEKRDVVIDNYDRLRFVQNLFLFNDSQEVPSTTRKGAGIREKNASSSSTHTRNLLVRIYAWCLMTNHYHLLLSPINNDPSKLSLFMKKINMGYAKYFNERYNRSGYLWQGRYKKIPVKQDPHFLYIPYYIHLNPLDLTMPEWRKGSVIRPQEALKHLKAYRWSSYLDYAGGKNFPSLIQKNFLLESIGSPKVQERETLRIISSPEIASHSLNIE